MKAKLQQLVAQGKPEKAIQKLLSSTKHDDHLHSRVLILSARFREWKYGQQTGTLNNEQIQIELSKINTSILEFANELSETNPSGLKTNWDLVKNCFLARDNCCGCNHYRLYPKRLYLVKTRS